jgi:hypothetical protein
MYLRFSGVPEKSRETVAQGEENEGEGKGGEFFGHIVTMALSETYASP